MELDQVDLDSPERPSDLDASSMPLTKLLFIPAAA